MRIGGAAGVPGEKAGDVKGAAFRLSPGKVRQQIHFEAEMIPLGWSWASDLRYAMHREDSRASDTNTRLYLCKEKLALPLLFHCD